MFKDGFNSFILIIVLFVETPRKFITANLLFINLLLFIYSFILPSTLAQNRKAVFNPYEKTAKHHNDNNRYRIVLRTPNLSYIYTHILNRNLPCTLHSSRDETHGFRKY